jgi:uncharacterized protein (TIGR03437 family)
MLRLPILFSAGLAAAVVCAAQTSLTFPATAAYTEVNDLTPAQPVLERTFLLDAASSATVTLVSSSATLKISLIDPGGQAHPLGVTDSVVNSSSTFSGTGSATGGQNYVFGLSNPPPGVWKYHVTEAGPLTQARAVLFSLISSSPVVARLLGGGADYAVNQDIGISLVLADGNGPIQSGSLKSINATVVPVGGGSSTAVSFLDDGKGFDSAANDGIYTVTFRLSQAGSYMLGATISGSAPGGDFIRHTGTSFRVVTPCGTLAPAVSSAAVDLNGNALTDALDLSFKVTAASSGKFLLFATLTASNGNSASRSAAFATAAAGDSVQSVRFPVDALQTLGVNGPYQVSSARLECLSGGGAQVSDQQSSLGTTVPLDLTQLERPAVVVSGQNTDAGVDTNGNGLFDRLDVNVGVNVLNAGAYTWSASLFAAGRTELAHASGNGSLPAGATTVLLSFDGASIGAGATDGPYTIQGLVVSGGGASVMLGNGGSTSAYQYDQFEGAPPRLVSGSVLSGASFLSGAIAPGQVVSIFGRNLGPAVGVGLQFAPGSSTMISTNLAGVVVTFNGIAAPLFFVRADQINCQAPIELDGQTSATVTVTYQNQVVTGTSVQVVPVAPSIFTIAGGKGMAAMFNQNGTVHSLLNPAAPGSVIQIYLTGQGVVTPPLANGQLAPGGAPFPAPPLPISVTIGGRTAPVKFAGMAPNLVGLFQVNALVPAGTPAGSAVPLIVTIGTAASQPGVTIAVSGPGGGVPQSPSISAAPSSLDFGQVSTGQHKDLTISIANGGSATLSVQSIASSDASFSVVSPAVPFNVAAGGAQPVTVRFSPSAAVSHSGTLTITSNDPVQGRLNVPLSGAGKTAPAVTVLFSDSFNRPDADRCSLGQADFALGGDVPPVYYAPVWGIANDPTNPAGANIVSGTLQNNGTGYGGVEFASAGDTCTTFPPDWNIGQDLNMKVDVLVPADTAGHITEAGPFFRGRAAAAGDGLFGGDNAGYWVQLYSTGEVKVKNLNDASVVAASAKPGVFDATVFHTIEAAFQGQALQVTVDGQLVVFTQNGSVTTTVSLAATAGSNQGTGGISFGSDSGQIGGQRADNMVVTLFRQLP